MKKLLFILSAFTLLSFCKKQENVITRTQVTGIVTDVGKSNFDASKLESITKIDKKHFTSSVNFRSKNDKANSSYIINDKAFNWAYYNKSVYPSIQKGKEVNAKLYLSVYSNKEDNTKLTIVDSIKTVD